MPAKTQDFKQLLENSKNVYEAVLMISRRARQINEEMYQKKRDRQILEELEGNFDEDILQSEIDEVDQHDNQAEEDNPVVFALEDFMRSKLDKRYPSTINKSYSKRIL